MGSAQSKYSLGLGRRLFTIERRARGHAAVRTPPDELLAKEGSALTATVHRSSTASLALLILNVPELSDSHNSLLVFHTGAQLNRRRIIVVESTVRRRRSEAKLTPCKLSMLSVSF